MFARRTRFPFISALLAFPLAAGCMAASGPDEELEDDALGATEEALVGGTATLSYPETGQYWRPIPGSSNWTSCTATLFAPRYVITAAHCIGYTDIAVRAGEMFRITDALGYTHDYTVDKIATFGNYRYEYVPGTSLTTDIAILRLSTPVPSTVATPRALASSLPTNGTRVSTYGYGCTERVNQTGGGYKQFFPWNYGDATTALCPGDSGGPAVYGDWLNPGQIWGINSDYTGAAGQFPSWTDLFGHVPFMRPRIGATTRQWEAHDFNADGKSDVLWHNPTTGEISAWLLDGGVNAVNHIETNWTAAESTGWRAVGSGDFNNDGNSDVLWWHAPTGAVSMWLLDGAAQVLGTQDPGWRASEATGWKIVGTGDFNGDGNTDIVWWHGGSGEVNPWYLDGRGNVIGNGAFSWRAAASTNWKPVGTGDFNRDGAMDLLWHETVSGQISYWQMDYAGNVQAGPTLSWTTAESSGWKIVGTGDYNGDNKIDILWHHPTSGQLSVWYVDGATVTGHGEVNWWTAESAGWKIVGR
jgi:V8-like Glu-specific endopeptidase